MSNVLVRHFLRTSSGWLVVGVLLFAFTGITIRQRIALHDLTINHSLSQIPQSPKNASAQVLEQHLQKLGLGVPEPKNAGERSLHTAFVELKPALDQYLGSQRSQVTHALAPLPDEIQTYLQQNQPELAATQQDLLSQPLPTWTTDFAQITHPQYQDPDFFPLARLQRLLLVKAISEQEKPEAMAQSLDAAWQLVLALRSRPDLLSQVFANILAQQQAGLLRHLDHVPSVWNARLRLNPQSGVLNALQFDSWIEYKTLRRQFSRSHHIQANSSSFDRLYLQLSRVDWQRSRQRSYEQLARSDSACHVQPQQLEVTSSWWNVFGSSGTPQWGREWVRAGDRQLAVELTRHVLRVKALAQKEGDWPAELATMQSQVCPDIAWVYQRTPDGIEIGLNRLPTWRVDATHELLPLRYRFSGPPKQALSQQALSEASPEARPNQTVARIPD